jgi:uroporphyrinogen III methyltransferase/synthase
MTQQAQGKVYLVGAGPGDVGLVTRRAVRCLEAADVVVYDYLVNPALLAYCRAGAELVYVGKKAGDHTLSQEQINNLLLEKAQQGKCVVRLKGGDPFVFGRGGEEALCLAQSGVPFEIVPGVTSAVAVPAYAGIPVTHRGMAVSFHVFTAHEAPDKPESDLDWKSIARLDGTLVFLMGVRTLDHVVNELLRHGYPATAPVALIRWGTLPEQEVLTGTLKDIVQRAREHNFAPPAVTVIGEVVQLRQQLRWAEKKPLFGYRIALTRPREQSLELAELLEHHGADVLITPTIKIHPRPLNDEIRAEIRRLSDYQWVVFTSANGVKIFCEYLEHFGLDARAFSESRIAAIGDKTAQTLREHGLRADAVPSRFVQESLAEAIPVRPNDRVLIPRAAVARDALERMLLDRGARVKVLPVYDTLPDDEGIRALIEGLTSKRINGIVFTSASTVEGFAARLTPALRADIAANVLVASIGPLTSAALKKAGITPTVEAKVHTGSHLAQAILEYAQTTTQRFRKE